MNRKARARSPLYRNLWVMALGGICVLFALLALLVGMSLRGAERLAPLNENLARFEQLELELRSLLEANGRGSLENDDRVIRPRAHGEGRSSPNREIALRNGPLINGDSVAENGDSVAEQQSRYERMRQVGQGLAEGVQAQRLLLQRVDKDNARELNVVLALVIILPLLTAVGWALYRSRVLKPLDDLGSAISLLARKDFRTVEPELIDPAIRPVFVQYNRMVGRMRDLEEGHVKREQALSQELEHATRSLLNQQALLARADRLAASGDMAARMAHLLRSPLSGVKLTLTNIYSEADSIPFRERLSMAIEALRRSFSEMSLLVAEAKQDPEPLGPVPLRALVEDLLLLVGYGTENGELVMENKVPEDLICNVPEAGARHALMCLLTNSLEAQKGLDQKFIAVEAADLGDRVRISVRDHGPGFSEPTLRTEHTGGSAWSRRGLGLGLAIVRRFVEHLGGRLELENPAGGGSRAVLVIPREATDG